jgi:hypothetical protein
MKRHWRRWLVVALLLASGVLGVRWYLSSYLVKARVTARLESLYGGRIQVGGVKLGLEHSILTGVELFEQGQGPGDPPWLRIEWLQADIALSDLIKGRQPTCLHAAGVTITLRFDDNGRIATVLPPRPTTSTAPLDMLPAMTMTDSRLVLLGTRGRQMQIDNIVGTLRPGTQGHALEATGSNSCCRWKADGAIDLAKKDVTITMHSDRDIEVTERLLRSLPFVAASVWKEVQVQGATPVAATLAFDWGQQRQSFRVRLQPKRAAVHVAAIDLTTTDLSGEVDIENGTITLSHLQGTGHGGSLALDGQIDFRADGTRFHLANLAVKNLNMRRLPPSWSLPPQLEGRLDAGVALDILAAPGKRHIQGSGGGVLHQARIAGQSTAQPIGLALRSIAGATQLAIEGHLPLSELAPLAEAFGLKLPPATAGKLALDVQALLPLDTINDRRTYRATAKAVLESGHIAGIPVPDASADLDYADGMLSTVNLQAALGPRGTVAGRAALRLTEPYGFQVHLEPQSIDLALLDQLDESLRPAVHARGRVGATLDIEGKLQPWSAASRGKATAADLIVQGWSIPAASLQWSSDREQLKITAIDAKAYDGQITGTAQIPLQPGATSELDLQFQGIELHQLARDHFAVPVPVDGQVDGTLHGTLSADPDDLTLALKARSKRLLLDRVAADAIAADLRYNKGFLTYHAKGRTLGGTFVLEGDVAMDERVATARPQVGRLRMQQIDLGRLPAIWDPGAATANVGGAMDIDLHFRHDGADRFPISKGHAVVTDLAWKSQTFASQVEGDVVLNRQQLIVQDLTSTLGNGTFAGKMVINLKEPERSWYRLHLESGEAAELLQLWPALAQELQGAVSVQARGTLGRQWTGAADVVLTRGKVLGVDVAEWRVPLRYTFEPASGVGQLDVTDSTATVAQGKVTGHLNAAWTDALRLNGKLNFVGVDLHQAFPAAKLGQGRATGHAEFSGDHVKGLDDLQGTLVAGLQHTQALEFPVLKQVAPVLGLPTTATFQSGELQARLARSVVHIERLSFPEGPLQLFAEGQVALQGRVNLDVTANTGKLTNVLAMVGIRLPETGMIGGDLLKRASAALSPNLVRVHITGTLHQPTLQVVPLPTLTDRALRFFAK